MTLRSAELEALFGTQLANAAAGSVHELVAGGARESEVLELKGEHYDRNDRGRLELAKDVAALANRRGGVIVLGVEEDHEARAATARGVVMSDDEIGRIRQTIAARVVPLPDVDVRALPDPDLGEGVGFVLLAVSPSVLAPHAVVDAERLRYPVRHGTTTRFLTEPDVADAYRRRFAAASDREERLTVLAREAAPARGSRGFLVVTLAPERLGSMRIDRSTFQQFREFADQLPSFAPWYGGAFVDARVSPRSLRASSYPSWGEDGEFAAYTDGAGTFTQALTGLPVDTTRQRWSAGEQHFVIDDEQLAAAVLCAVHDLCAQAVAFAGTSGTAIISAQVLGPAGDPVLHLGHSRNMVALAVTDAPSAPERVYAYADIDACANFGAAGTAVAAGLLHGLGHSLGAAEMLQLTHDGRVTLSGWSSRDQTQSMVRAWATQFGIDVAR